VGLLWCPVLEAGAGVRLHFVQRVCPNNSFTFNSCIAEPYIHCVHPTLFLWFDAQIINLKITNWS